MLWYIYINQDGEEVRVAADNWAAAINMSCNFIRDGFDVVRIESELGSTITADIIWDLCRREG